MARKIPSSLQRELAATFRPADVRWSLPARRYKDVRERTRDLPQFLTAHDVAAADLGARTPVDYVSMVGVHTLLVAAAALGGGYLIGRWWKKRHDAQRGLQSVPGYAPPQLVPPVMTRLPAWAIS